MCLLILKYIFVNVFPSIGIVSKSVETYISRLYALLVVELKCKHGIFKCFNLRFFEANSLEVILILRISLFFPVP